MGLTIFEASKDARKAGNLLAAGMLEEITKQDMLFQYLQFAAKRGEGFSYQREKSIGSFAFVSDAHSSVPESTAETNVVTVPKRQAVTDMIIPNFASDNIANVLAEQLGAKAKAIAHTLGRVFIQGKRVTSHTLGAGTITGAVVTAIEYGPNLDSDRYGTGYIKYTHGGQQWQFKGPGDRKFGPAVAITVDGSAVLYSDNPSMWIKVTVAVAGVSANSEVSISFASNNDEPDGLLANIPTGQVRQAVQSNGDELTANILDQLIDAVDVSPDQAVFLMPRALRRKYQASLRSNGGTTPGDFATLPNGKQVIAYSGYPILTTDHIPVNETKGTRSDLSSAILVSLNDPNGWWVGANGPDENQFNLSVPPVGRPVMGLQLIRVGHMESKNSQIYRVVWYGSGALGSTKAAARAMNLRTDNI